MSWTMAVLVRFNSLYISFAVLCKTATSNDQILGFPENANDSAKILNLYSDFNAVFHIQFRDSLNSEKQAKRLKDIARFVGKM